MNLTKALCLKTAFPALRGFFLAGAATLLVACSSPMPKVVNTDPAMSSLDQALERSRADLPLFTATSTAKPAAPKEKGPALSLDYAGEAKVLLVRLAAANGRQFKILGPQPHLPLFVIVNAKNAELLDVMRDIGEQFGERADLVLTDKAIEVQYRAR